MTLEKQILTRIQRQKIKPTPKGYFLARAIVLWLIVALSIAALGIGFGMIIYMLKSNDIPLISKLGLSATKKIISSVPLFWILITLLVGGISFFNFRNTRKGYRMSGKQFGIVAAIIGLGVGLVAYTLNVTEYLDEVAADNIPIYNIMVPINTRTWFDPAHGLLSGQVRNKDSDAQFQLRGRDGELWDVIGKNINLPTDYEFHPGDRIKIIGAKVGTTTFEATDIYPWKD